MYYNYKADFKKTLIFDFLSIQGNIGMCHVRIYNKFACTIGLVFFTV